MSGLLLDTHSLLWLDSGMAITSDALFHIGRAQALQSLFYSQIAYWEIGVALHKKTVAKRPDLRGLSVESWFREFELKFTAAPLPISSSIALQAAEVPATYGSGDPGDCFIIATARTYSLSLVTRDGEMLKLAKTRPDYLSVVPC